VSSRPSQRLTDEILRAACVDRAEPQRNHEFCALIAQLQRTQIIVAEVFHPLEIRLPAESDNCYQTFNHVALVGRKDQYMYFADTLTRFYDHAVFWQ
jgi:hypothetical protein